MESTGQFLGFQGDIQACVFVEVIHEIEHGLGGGLPIAAVLELSYLEITTRNIGRIPAAGKIDMREAWLGGLHAGGISDDVGPELKARSPIAVFGLLDSHWHDRSCGEYTSTVLQPISMPSSL